MYYVLFLFVLLSAPYTITAAPQARDMRIQTDSDALASVDALIRATETNLAKLQAIRKTLAEYKEKETLAIQNPDDTDNLLELVNLAKELDQAISDSLLQNYLPQQFLEEIKKLSNIALKKNIPPAK